MRSRIPQVATVTLVLLLAHPCLAGELPLKPNEELPCNQLCRAWLGLPDKPAAVPIPSNDLPSAKPPSQLSEVHPGPTKRSANTVRVATSRHRAKSKVQASTAAVERRPAHPQPTALAGTDPARAQGTEPRQTAQSTVFAHSPSVDTRPETSSAVQSAAPPASVEPAPDFMPPRAYEPTQQAVVQPPPPTTPSVDDAQTANTMVVPEARAVPQPQEPIDPSKAASEPAPAPAQEQTSVEAAGADKNGSQAQATDAPTGATSETSVPSRKAYDADLVATADAIAATVRFLPWDAVGTLLLERTPMTMQ